MWTHQCITIFGEAELTAEHKVNGIQEWRDGIFEMVGYEKENQW